MAFPPRDNSVLLILRCSVVVPERAMSVVFDSSELSHEHAWIERG